MHRITETTRCVSVTSSTFNAQNTVSMLRQYDRPIELAVRLFDLPMALISFIAEDRPWFKAKSGVALRVSNRPSRPNC